ncbi:hypothetical protein OJ997_10370 [Solirubrobacter phytolaccae]|uniref:Uncharacterized protein n=1 Tax=Solirubrobacter phytolaccae TaxID=1404360 RepID=A0A9X3N9E8_9ACTN|nr:hypothetical protein [Solirubrobacter phytolaccae]MDA0180697.1 hypothetical protein [Solirubrobacter phytolaccae]
MTARYSSRRSHTYAAALCALLVLAAAPRAGAAAIPVRDDVDAAGLAFAGPELITLRERDDGLQLVAQPRNGGPARSLLTVRRGQLASDPAREMTASAERVALIAEIEDGPYRVYAGPPAGPLAVVRSLPEREEWEPLLVDADGDRVLILEAKPTATGDGEGSDDEDQDEARAFLLHPTFGLVPIAWANGTRAPLALAGERALAYLQAPTRLAVVDLATGTEQVAIPLDSDWELDADLAPDGRVLVSTGAGVTLAAPGVAPQLIPNSRGLTRARFAGNAITAIEGNPVRQPVLLGADGARTPLGLPTRILPGFAADPAGFAWIANGCIRSAAIPLTPAAPGGKNPCPTTEAWLYGIPGPSKLRGRTIQAPVGCVTAPRDVCRGTLVARVFEGGPKIIARGRFSVPAGKERTVKMRVTRAAAAQFRRKGYGQLLLDAQIRNGRVGSGGNGAAELTVEID